MARRLHCSQVGPAKDAFLEAMKILVAYDGSQCSEAAIDDLNRAGLPSSGEAVVITVAEVWLPPPNGADASDAEVPDPYIEAALKRYRDKGERMLNEAAMLAEHAAKRLRNVLRGWKVSSYTSYGSPAWEVISRAEDIEPDLIIIGSQGHSALSRIVLGSTSQKVLSESGCSVRIARGRNEVEPVAERRLMIGYDGSPGANAAVDAVAARNWSPETLVQIICVMDPVVPSTIGRFITPVSEWAEGESTVDHAWATEMAKNAVGRLADKGITAESRTIAGNPKSALIREAENWHADCLFVGATSHTTRIGRLLLGSTAAALAARAHCSVEVVRVPAEAK